MRLVKICIAGIFVFSLLALTACAEEGAKEAFPKSGYVKNDGAQIKAGDNANFENLCALSKSEPVKIMDKRYSWFKVLLPKKAALYVSNDYVTLTSDEKGVGVINASNVNLRAGAGTRYSIVGQISKPEKVTILSESAGWYKIEPPYGATGWVLSSEIELSKENEIKAKGKKEAAKEGSVKPPAAAQKREILPSHNQALKTSYPVPKGNLSISNSTKKQ